MSRETDKPFTCNFPGCGQRFANNDHLVVHQQKHEFSLKLGSAGRGDPPLIVDQTPTPTRFLKNCEEAGLFQELEASPFEQEFKSASAGKDEAGHAKNAHSSKTPRTISSEAMQKVLSNTQVTVGSTSIPVAPPPNTANPQKSVPMATAPSHVNVASQFTKQKLLANIQMREQSKILEQAFARQLSQVGQPATPEILEKALNAIMPTSDVSQPSDESTPSPSSQSSSMLQDTQRSGSGKRRGRKPEEEDPEVKRQKFLERNRAAASRCRAKKKVWVENLERKSKDIEMMNSMLQQEVLMLRSEVQQLKSILIAHKDCPLIVHQTVIPKPGEEDGVATGMTLINQLSNLPSLSPLISTPVPSVGSVVPNISLIMGTPSGPREESAQGTPEVAKDVEISADSEQ
ncbi:hypothetical protein EMCRGX_G004052 [Ephydatia muelleri]|eukprot:Em0158g10a